MTEIRKFHLENLDCANCAAKIEEGVQKMPGVRFAKVNFATSSIHLDADNLKDVENKIREMEPEVRFRSTETPKTGLDAGAKRELTLIIISLVLFILGLVFDQWLDKWPYFSGQWVVFMVAYLVSGYRVLWRAVQNLRNRNWFDETFLMSISTIGAIAIGELPEAVGVMLFYQIGEFVQQRAVNRSRNMIQSLMDVRPDSATLIRENEEEVEVLPQEVSIGDTILVRPGEKVPLDGTVLSGQSQIDASILTGESMPITVSKGSEVYAGTVNQNGVLKILVNRTIETSSVSKMLELVQSAANRKARTELFITKFAKIYSPLMVLLALMVAFGPPLIVPGETFAKWIYRALVLLVVSCPCALVISIPLGYFGGIGGASRRGILVKGANFLDVLAEVRTVVFDKTGTLTKGEFKVSEIMPENGISKESLLKLAVYAESHSNHPVANSIRQAYTNLTGDLPNGAKEVITEYDQVAGYGIRARVNGDTVVVGNDAFLHLEDIQHPTCDVPGTVIHVSLNQNYQGYLVVRDEPKPEAKAAVEQLHRIGVENVLMLSGDQEGVVKSVSESVGLDGYQAGLLPDEKVNHLEDLLKEHKTGRVAYVGDGINDAPALARADVGIAMGAFGTDAAKETADVVLMTDSISRVPEAIIIGRRTRRIVWQNIGIALGIKALFILLGVLGAASMWEAVFADVGVTVLAVLNSTRGLR
jgi:Cd2+/Zn2+-exporting ATPase